MPHLFFCIHSSEFENTSEDSPQPGARVVVAGHTETPGKLRAAAEDGKRDQITEAGQDEELSCSAQSLRISLSLQKTGKGFRAEELRLKPLQRDKLGVCFQG